MKYITKEEIEILNNLLKQFFCGEAKGQGIKELNLREYTCQELIEAIEEKLNN